MVYLNVLEGIFNPVRQSLPKNQADNTPHVTNGFGRDHFSGSIGFGQ